MPNVGGTAEESSVPFGMGDIFFEKFLKKRKIFKNKTVYSCNKNCVNIVIHYDKYGVIK